MARIEVTLPALGESVTEGLLTQWMVEVGDVVEEDQPIFEISTDKIDTEVPAPASGTIVEIRSVAGDEVEIGAVVAVIETDADAPGGASSADHDDAAGADDAAQNPSGDSPPSQDKSDTTGGGDSSGNADGGASSGPGAEPRSGATRSATGPTPTRPSPTRPSPSGPSSSTQSEASQTDTPPAPSAPPAPPAPPAAAADTQGQPGTGASSPQEAPAAPGASNGDVDRSAPPRTERIPRSYLSTAVADHVAQSWARIPQVNMTALVNLDGLIGAIRAHQDAWTQRNGFSLTLLPFVARATAAALSNFPAANAVLSDGEVVASQDVNLGITVDLDHAGMVVPVVARASGMRVAQLAQACSALRRRAREGAVSPADLVGGTFTITDYSDSAVRASTAIVNQPEVAGLTIGGIHPEVGVGDGGSGLRVVHTCVLSLAFDHRAIDGSTGGSLLSEIKRNLETWDWRQELA